MNHKFLMIFILLFVFISCSKKHQSAILLENDMLISNYEKEIQKFQNKLNSDYLDPENSPLSKSQIEEFELNGGHKFYMVDQSLRITADFDTLDLVKNLKFETSTERLAIYDHYGTARFEIDGKQYSLKIYQSHRLREMADYIDHLFLPFNDLTNGEETYGGGRYMDLSIPKGNKITIDFNKTYNPYCAYTTGYSCPIPPIENYIEYAIKAGIKKPTNHY